MPEKKDYDSVRKGVHNQKLCSLQKLYATSKEMHPNVNIEFSKFCALRPKQRVLAGSKMNHFVCICSGHQNFVLRVDAIDWGFTSKKPDQEYCFLRAPNASCIGVNPVLALQLLTNFLIRNATNMKMIRNLTTVRGTLRIDQY